MKIPPAVYDRELGLYPVFIVMSRAESIYLKLMLETYEGIAVVRNVEPDEGGGEVRQVILVVSDFVALVESVLAEFALEVPLRLIEPTAVMLQDLRNQLLGELDESCDPAK